MKTLKTVSGTVNPEPKTINLKTGDNFFNMGRFKDVCNACMNYKDITYVFALSNGKILSQRCENCFE